MIKVEHLTKYYDDFLAVDDLSFEIEDGHVYGFLGPNGAGKSTTMNIMTGCLSASEGMISIGGYDILQQPLEAKKLIGYLPEIPPLYLNETPREYLTFVGQVKGLSGTELQSQIERVIDETKISNVANRIISALSKGYKQRVGIAQALLGNPEVIILDEPTVGLDPIQIIEIRQLIKDLGKEHTVIFSSHILSEVQAICEKVLIIAKGKLVAFDTPENLEKLLKGNREMSFKTNAPLDVAEKTVAQIQEIKNVEFEYADADMLSVSIKTEAGTDDIDKKLSMAFAKDGYAVFDISFRRANLEDVFIELTEKTDESEVSE